MTIADHSFAVRKQAPKIKHRVESLVGCSIDGRYDVLRHLSTGGMASVYEAIDAESGCRLALKVLHAHHARAPATLRRFHREATLVDVLDGRYVASVHGIGCWKGFHYLTLDLLIGQDLRQLLRTAGKLPVPFSVDVALDVCRGLRAAHAAGLVHRDVKPSNIFIAESSDGARRAKLLDFGIAKYAPQSDSTDEGSFLGTVWNCPDSVDSLQWVNA